MTQNTSTLIQSARVSAGILKSQSVVQRLVPIKKLKQIIIDEFEAIIDQIQNETSKSRTDALMSEIFPVLDFINYLEKNAAKILKDRNVPSGLMLLGKKSNVYFEPLGVILIISPWNYPFFQAVIPILLAYVTGNAAVLKPSEHTPLKGLFEALFLKAQFEPGCIKIAYGDGAVGAELIAAKPDKIFFTGSVGTGKKILKQASENLTPVELELGGKDPMIVFDDVDLKRAVNGALWGAFTNCGQACTSVERLYVHKNIYEPFKKLLQTEVSKITQSVDKEGSADIGNMSVDFQLRVLKSHIEDAQSHGATQLTMAKWDGQSRKVPPLVFENLKPSALMLKEETFGPILPLVPFSTEDEAIQLANDSEFGLSASVWSGDLKRAKRVARALEVGNVSINNVMLTEGNSALPFGGVKHSGSGRYKGEFGFYSFSNIKSVLIDKNSSKIEVNWYPYTKEKYHLFKKMMIAFFSKRTLGNLIKFLFFGLRLEGLSQKGRKNS